MGEKDAMEFRRAPLARWALYYDPIYGHLEVPPIIRSAMNLRSLQRLRWIRQLSTLQLVFPGATHTRFEHSVGVYHLASLVFDSLVRKSKQVEAVGWPRVDLQNIRLAVLLAALLHDVGHGPWSHTFDIFCMNSDWADEGLKHKDLSPKIIRGEIKVKFGEEEEKWDDIYNFLTKLAEKKKGEDGAEFLEPNNIAAIVSGTLPPHDQSYVFLSNIIAGTYDVDRLDYLSRDPFHIGIKGGVDNGAIIHAFTLAQDPDSGLVDSPKGKVRPWRLSLKPEAAEAVEEMLAARDMMYRRIYYNKTHRMAQELLIRALYEIGEKIEDPIERATIAMMTDEQLLRKFEEMSPFTKDVADRIRIRKLYEAIPGEIVVGLDLDKYAKSKWSLINLEVEDKKPHYKEFLEGLRVIEKEVGCKEDERILVLLDKAPLSKQKDYSRPMFFIEETGELLPLTKLLPHLNLLHGEYAGPDSGIDLHLAYEEATSKIIIAVPPTLIERVVNKHIKGTDGLERDVGNVAELTYDQVIKPVVDALLEFLNFVEEVKKNETQAKLRKQSLSYIDNVVDYYKQILK